MLNKYGIARIISDRYTLRGGERIPIYLAEWMVDYVLNAIKIGVIEDGVVDLKQHISFERIDVPEHEKRMPDGTYATIPARSKVRVQLKPRFLDDVNREEVKEIYHRVYSRDV